MTVKASMGPPPLERNPGNVQIPMWNSLYRQRTSCVMLYGLPSHQMVSREILGIHF